MNGMEIMLKSFGVDPNEIKQGLASTVEVVKSVDARLQRIEQGISVLAAVTLELKKAVENGHGTSAIGIGDGESTSGDCASGNIGSHSGS